MRSRQPWPSRTRIKPNPKPEQLPSERIPDPDKGYLPPEPKSFKSLSESFEEELALNVQLFLKLVNRKKTRTSKYCTYLYSTDVINMWNLTEGSPTPHFLNCVWRNLRSHTYKPKRKHSCLTHHPQNPWSFRWVPADFICKGENTALTPSLKKQLSHRKTGAQRKSAVSQGHSHTGKWVRLGQGWAPPSQARTWSAGPGTAQSPGSVHEEATRTWN